MQEAKAVLSSQKEVNRLNQFNLKEQIKSRKSQKLEKIKSYLSGATFGSKKLFKAQFTNEKYINEK